MSDDRRKFNSEIPELKLLTVAEAARSHPTATNGSRVAAVMQFLQHDDFAVDVSASGDRGLFLLH
jgi:hypothetical protein